MDLAPVDYVSGLGQLPDALKTIQQQQAFAINLQGARLQLDAAAKAEQRKQAFQGDLQALMSDPSAKNVSSLMMKYPEFADDVKKGWDVKDKAAKDADFTQLSEMWSALDNGHPELAARTARARYEADKAAGLADDSDLGIVEALESGDPKQIAQAKGMIGIHVGALAGPEHFASVNDSLKGGYTLDQGAARYDNSGKMIAHSPFIQDADGNIRLWTDTDAPPDASTRGLPSDSAAPPAQGGFDNAVATVLGNEGGYNPKDMNGAPVNYGINAKANAAELRKLGVSNIKDLTRDQAIQIYRDKYWKGSGAENLPPNLQTPYFDVYIRNERVAKHALDQSGGDPAKFMQLSSAYFQNLAKSKNGQKYGQAWANRDANNLAIATGQAAPEDAAPAHAATSTATERFPIAILGKQPTVRDLTPAEVTASGRDPSHVWQIDSSTGKITDGGPSTADDDAVLTRYHIDPQETGPSVLAKLPATIASQVKALAEGRRAPPSSTALARSGAGAAYWGDILKLTNQYDPTYDDSSFPARKAAITAFTGNGKGAQIVGSVNRVANHLDLLWNESKKLAGPDVGWGPANSVLAATGQSFEPADAKAYDGEVTFVAGELGKIAKAGVVTEGEVDRIIGNLGRKNSTKTREAAIQAAVGIISGAVDPLKDQYNSAFTNDSTRPKIPWVSPKAQAIYKKIGGIDTSLTDSGADTNTADDTSSAVVQVRGLADYNALKPGTHYIDPNGVARIKH